MANTQKNTPLFSNITKKRIASSKGLLLFSAILALILDGAALVMLAINTTDNKFIICPLLLLLLDIVLIFKAIFSNYRFSYAIKGIFIHILSVILVCAYMIVSNEILDGRIIFTTFALYAMPAVHLIHCLASMISAFHASNKKKAFRHVMAICMTVLFTAGVAIYGIFLAQNGFFGQTNKRTNRTVVYTYDEAKGYYVISEVLKGFGNTIVVPETFDGVPVGGINCEIFSDENLSYVVLDCSTDIEILNVRNLNNANKNLKFETKKTKIDSIRKKFFEYASQNTEFLSLANSITPNDLSEGQIYIVFCYDRSSLATAGGEILPTWFGTSRDTFDIYSHAAGVKYIEYSIAGKNDSNEKNNILYWCTQNQSNMIFNSVRDDNGNIRNNTTVSESMKLNVSFEKIYQINIGEDNDNIYTLDAQYTSLNTPDGVKPYKLATAGSIQSVLDAIKQRPGFNRTFKTGSDKHEITDIDYEISVLDQAGMFEIDVYPHWELRAPTITQIAADGKTTGHSAVYGSDVKLTSEAISPDSEISLKYEWTKSGLVASTASHTISNLQPGDAGEYTLTVTAYSSASSLTSTATQTINVGFAKKELHFNWILPVDKIYSATAKEVIANPVQADIINSDEVAKQMQLIIHFTYANNINSTQQVNGVQNAGNYRVSVELTGDAATKYAVSTDDASREFTIDPYSVYVNWENTNQFEYDGTVKGPTATVTGLGSDGNVQLYIDGRKTNAGDYVAVASTTNTNYTLLETEKSYTITKKPISAITWQGTTSFVYDSEIHYPTVEGLTGVAAIDRTKVLEALVYSGQQVNAGNGYTVSVNLGDALPSSNYVFDCSTSTSFSITPKPMTLTIANLTTEYTGTVIDHLKYKFSTNDVAANDKITEIVSLAYKTYIGDVQTDAINVNAQNYTISADLISGDKFNNYQITITTGTLRITPKDMTVTLNNQQKVYNGVAFESQYTYTSSGLISAYDKFSDVIGELTFAEISDRSVGTYDITASVKAANQGPKYNNYNITIVPATLTITKAPLTVTAVGSTKVYDGYAFSNDAFGIAVVGTLYESKTPADLGTTIFAGKATSEKNVGTYTLTVSLVENDINKNYDISFKSGDATITPKPITITVLDASKTYNGATGATGVSGGTFDFEVSSSELGYGDTKSSLGKVTYGGSAVTATDAGTYTINVTGIASSNYTIGSVNTGTFTIEKKSITVQAVATTKTYDGTPGTAGNNFTVTANGLVSGENVSILGTPVYSGAATTAVNAGQYTLTVEYVNDLKNYVVAQYYTAVFTIQKANFTINVLSNTKVYDGEAVELSDIQYTVSGLYSGDTVQMLGTPRYSGSLATNNLGSAGAYQLILTLPGNENYNEGTVVSDYTITPKNITVTAVATDKVYDGIAGGSFSITANGLVNGETVSVLGTPSFYGNATTAKNVGDYTLEVKFNGSTGNYNVTNFNSATFKITPKDITVSAVATNKVYSGTAGGNFSITAEGLIAGETVSVLGTPSYYGDGATATNVGNYTLKVTFSGSTGNYNVVKFNDATFQITRKDIIVSAVATGKVYDGGIANGNFSATATGLVNGETVSVLGTPTFSGNATTAKNAGEYTLEVKFNNTGNYNVIQYNSATFKITPKDITVSAVATDKVYDGIAGGNFSITVDGLVNGETVSVLGTYSFSGNATTAVDAGEYTLEVKFNGTTGNYNVTRYNSATFKITPKAVTVTAVATDRAYKEGEKGGEFSFTMSGLVNGSEKDFVAVFSGDAVEATEIGTYQLKVEITSGTNINNYTFSYVDAQFKIS